MCLIAHRPEGSGPIPDDVIEHNLKVNPDGFGLMWRQDGKVQTRKYGPAEVKKFEKLLGKLNAQDIEIGVHWRRATSGGCSREMAHPFRYTDKDGNRLALMHNGIIDIVNYKNHSDTSTFVIDVLQHLPYGWWDNATMMWLVEKSISWSKLLIMSERETIFVNQRKWLEPKDGISYSTTPVWTTSSSTSKPSVVSAFDKTKWNKGTGYQGRLIDDWENHDSDCQCYYCDRDAWTDYKKEDVTTLAAAAQQISDDEWLETTDWTQVDGTHLIVPLNVKSKGEEGDRAGDAECIECGESGPYYIVEGQPYVDIKHVLEGGSTSALVPVTAADVIEGMLTSGIN